MAMKKLFIRQYICSAVLFIILMGGPSAKAADMTITSLSPANNAVEICADTKLWITFGTTPIAATSGSLQICKVSDDSVIWQLNLQVITNPPVTAGWPYQYTSGTKTFNYQPFMVSGNTLEIFPYPQLGQLQYNTEYYVKMTAGFCTDSAGGTSPAINDNVKWRFRTKAAAPTQDHDFMISFDGTGDFCTIQGAMDSVGDTSVRTIIKMKNGTYREFLDVIKDNVTLLGQDKDLTIIAAFNNNNFNNASTDLRRLVGISGAGFRMYNLTLRNTTPDGGSQAETIKNSGQHCIASNCNFRSYQDTLLINGQMYFNNCHIEGDTDYIWGSGTAYFDKCQMNSLSNTSYVFQPRTPDGVNGFFIVDCNLTAPRGIRNCYLGRFFENYGYAQVAMINCIMPGTLFYPIGWYQNTLPSTDNLRMWEYKSVDQLGNLINISGRLTPGSKQLSDAEAVTWRDVNNVFAANPWNPKNLGEAPTASWQPWPSDGQTGVAPPGALLTWSAGAAATSHVVYFGTTNPPGSATEQTGTSFATGAMLTNTTYYWRIDEENSAGTTTGTVWSFTTFPYVCSSPINSDLDGNCQTDFFDCARLADAWAGNLPQVDLTNDGHLDFMDIAQFAADWLNCNREPASECWQ